MINTPQLLQAFVPELERADWVAMDTEADSLHAYPEKLCLIQVSIPGNDVLIDPLAGIDLAPLWRAVAHRTLVFHAADYDLRLLRRHEQFVPHSIFDTMLAARLAGETQFGLADLVQRFLGVTLEKGPQKADWARRPLSPRMEVYARNDTRYLEPLTVQLKRRLQEQGRLSWLEEWCAELVRETSQLEDLDPDRVWRIKGSHGLSRRALAVLKELWHWRDQLARANNRPPYFILPHDALVNLAEAAVNGSPLDPLMPRSYSPTRRASLKAALQKGLELPESQWPELIRREVKRMTEAQKKRFSELQARRDASARRLELDPTLIASKSTLLMLSESWDQNEKMLMDWQRRLLEQG